MNFVPTQWPISCRIAGLETISNKIQDGVQRFFCFVMCSTALIRKSFFFIKASKLINFLSTKRFVNLPGLVLIVTHEIYPSL